MRRQSTLRSTGVALKMRMFCRRLDLKSHPTSAARCSRGPALSLSKGLCVWLLAWTTLAGPSLSAADTLVISEFAASNSAGLQDENGDRSDWIELFNAGTNTVNAVGWSLTDSVDDPTKWVFPATNVAPGAFLVVFASGKDRRVPGAPLHTRFSLSAGGEYLALYRPDGTVASEFAPVFPAQLPDVSYGT